MGAHVDEKLKWGPMRMRVQDGAEAGPSCAHAQHGFLDERRLAVHEDVIAILGGDEQSVPVLEHRPDDTIQRIDDGSVAHHAVAETQNGDGTARRGARCGRRRPHRLHGERDVLGPHGGQGARRVLVATPNDAVQGPDHQVLCRHVRNAPHVGTESAALEEQHRPACHALLQLRPVV